LTPQRRKRWPELSVADARLAGVGSRQQDRIRSARTKPPEQKSEAVRRGVALRSGATSQQGDRPDSNRYGGVHDPECCRYITVTTKLRYYERGRPDSNRRRLGRQPSALAVLSYVPKHFPASPAADAGLAGVGPRRKIPLCESGITREQESEAVRRGVTPRSGVTR
jgi:hypothetical protein